MPGIKDLDAKILRYLLKDGRMGFEEIARACKVSKNKVWKHFKTMEKKGIIKGATLQVNFVHLGFDALATLLISVDPQQMEQVMQLIGKIAEIRAYRQYNSIYNIRATTTLKDLNELDYVKQIIKRKLPTTGLRTYIWTGVRNVPENLNLSGNLKDVDKPCQPILKTETFTLGERVLIDDLDRKIINKLAFDGRASFTKIGKEIGVSTDTVIKRYRKLKAGGTIKVSVQLNLNKIGYSAILDFNISSLSPKGLSDVMEPLLEIPDLIIVTRTSGDYDLQLTAMVRSLSESFDIQDKIARICGITKIEASARKIPDKWPTASQYISTF